MNEFTSTVVEIIGSIPEGKVATYGQVAKLAGSPRGARQVVRILHTQTSKHGLPWHRMINSKGLIAIKDEYGADEQKSLLLSEGVEVEGNKINLKLYLWNP